MVKGKIEEGLSFTLHVADGRSYDVPRCFMTIYYETLQGKGKSHW